MSLLTGTEWTCDYLNLSTEGHTPAECLDMAFRRALTMSKQEILKEEAEEKCQRGKTRAKRENLG